MERSLALDVAYLGVAEPGDGVAGTEFTQCVDVDTVTFNFSDAKELSFTSMGHEDPWAVVSRKGDPSSIEFTIPSPTSDEMKMFCGEPFPVINGRLPVYALDIEDDQATEPTVPR